MKIIQYTYKFRLNPSEEQKILLNKHFGSVRFIYNYFLNQRKEEYLNNQKTLNYYVQSKELTQIKKQENKNWLNEINSQTLQYTLNCLDNAYQGFFKKRTKFPQFKSKKSKNSFTIPQSTKIKDNKLIIYKFQEGIEMNMNRKIKGKIKKCTISKTPTNKYFVSILSELEYEPKQKTNKSIGIDLGIKDFLVTSDGLKIKNHKFLKHYEHLLKQNQKSLSRKRKESNRYERKRSRIARIYEKISNSRLDLIHKTSNFLINNYDNIYVEDLNIKGMILNHKLSKPISDVAWGKFIEILEYKGKWNDKKIIKIDRFFPSSKTCNKCGWIKSDLKLKDREWICPICDTKHDRDLNAAINIFNEGYRLNISVGTTDYGYGDQLRPDLSGIVYDVSKEMELTSRIH